MKSCEAFSSVCLGLFIGLGVLSAVESLLFSQYTVMQVVFCVSWPIPYKNPQRKLFFNTGFQFNYGEPFSLSSFYNPSYYQNIFDGRHHSDDNFMSSVIARNSKQSGTDTNATLSFHDNQSGHFTARSADGEQNDLIGSDLTAAQFYESIENNIQDIGYERNCLKKAICELARHPIYQENSDEHLLIEIINFILTPTKHNGFAESEQYERQVYEIAQQIGENGHNCDEIYSDCQNSIVNRFSNLFVE